MKSYRKLRLAIDKLYLVLIYLFAFTAFIPFFILIEELLRKGMKHIGLNFFTQSAPASIDALLAGLAGETIPGGILNGICGSIYMIAIAVVLAVPLGMMIGIYIHEHRGKKYVLFIRYITIVFYGIPSIVIGIVVYVLVVKTFAGFSALAGGISLAVCMLPMIIRNTKENLKMLPAHLKESGLALGGSYTGVMLRIIIPAAKEGLLTGILISVSRILGETAPLLVTALGCSMVNWDINSPTGSVSLLIWSFFNNPDMLDLLWSASLFLFTAVIGLHLIAKRIVRRWKIKLFYE